MMTQKQYEKLYKQYYKCLIDAVYDNKVNYSFASAYKIAFGIENLAFYNCYDKYRNIVQMFELGNESFDDAQKFIVNTMIAYYGLNLSRHQIVTNKKYIQDLKDYCSDEEIKYIIDELDNSFSKNLSHFVEDGSLDLRTYIQLGKIGIKYTKQLINITKEQKEKLSRLVSQKTYNHVLKLINNLN